MRARALVLAAGVLLVGPTVLAFFAGGYFDQPRLWAALVAWSLVVVVAVIAPTPLPTSWGGRAAVGGLALLTAWTGVSAAWAPLAGPANDAFVRLLLYLGALVAAAALLRDRRAARAVEPVLAAGTLVVMAYGLAERLLPGLVGFEGSQGAGARLEQPITYWNAQGALAAMGLVLCARIAGDRLRTPLVRALAAAGAAPLGAGVYLSYSRGAIAAAVAGLVVLVAVAPGRPQLRAVVATLAAGLVSAGCSAAFPGVAAQEGTRSERIADGAAMLAVLVVVMLATALATAATARREGREQPPQARVGLARRLPTAAAVGVVLAFAGLVIGGLQEDGDGTTSTPVRASGAEADRLTTVDSRRYDYWRVGVDAVAEHPLRGTGAAGFRVVWRQERPVPEGALEVHSLPLEVVLELGLVGVLGLSLLVGGVALCARSAQRRHPALAAGPVAVGTVWVLHASIDWDWQIPAVTLPVLLLAGGLIAAGEREPEPPPAPAPALEEPEPAPAEREALVPASAAVSAARARPAGSSA